MYLQIRKKMLSSSKMEWLPRLHRLTKWITHVLKVESRYYRNCTDMQKKETTFGSYCCHPWCTKSVNIVLLKDWHRYCIKKTKKTSDLVRFQMRKKENAIILNDTRESFSPCSCSTFILFNKVKSKVCFVLAWANILFELGKFPHHKYTPFHDVYHYKKFYPRIFFILHSSPPFLDESSYIALLQPMTNMWIIQIYRSIYSNSFNI